MRLTQAFRLCAHEVTIGQFAKFVEQSGYKTQGEEFGFGNSEKEKPDDSVTSQQLAMTWKSPGYAVADDSPVTQVTWNDAVAFCNWLSGQEKLSPCYRRDGVTWTLIPMTVGYRLPTEAEWEYACRAGTTTQYWFGDDWRELENYGWFYKNAGGRARAVGLLPGNAWGLHDMYGNASEWCHDKYDSKYYERSPPENDPLGPRGSRSQVVRGANWRGTPAVGRSTSRSGTSTANRGNDRGFRPVLCSVGAKSSK